MWTEILAAMSGAGAGQVISYGIRKRRQKFQDIDAWYEEALSLISHGHGICLSARKRSNLNYGNISTQSRDISQRLKSHVNPYPEEVDEVVVLQIQNLARIFRKMSAVTEATDDQSTMESIDEIFEMCQREHTRTELDIGEAVDTSTDYSPIMKSAFDQNDIDPRVFGSQLQEELKDAESLQQLIETMGPQFGSSQKQFEKAIESQIVTDEWDESLSLGIRVHLQIATNLCEEAINRISEVSNMESAD